jgi:hypothetical protein
LLGLKLGTTIALYAVAVTTMRRAALSRRDKIYPRASVVGPAARQRPVDIAIRAPGADDYSDSRKLIN